MLGCRFNIVCSAPSFASCCQLIKYHQRQAWQSVKPFSIRPSVTGSNWGWWAFPCYFGTEMPREQRLGQQHLLCLELVTATHLMWRLAQCGVIGPWRFGSDNLSASICLSLALATRGIIYGWVLYHSTYSSEIKSTHQSPHHLSSWRDGNWHYLKFKKFLLYTGIIQMWNEISY